MRHVDKIILVIVAVATILGLFYAAKGCNQPCGALESCTQQQHK